MGAYGIKGHFGLGKEANWGAPVVAGDYVEILNEGITEPIERYDTVNVHASYEKPNDSAGLKRTSGPVTFAANPETLGFFLNMAMGVTSTSAILSGSLHTHEFTPALTDASSLCPLPFYTLEVNRDISSSHQYTGAAITGLGFNIAPNQALQVTADFVAKDVAIIAATSPTYTTSPDGKFAFDTCSISIAGAATARIEALDINVANGLEGIPALNNSDVIARIGRGEMAVALGGTIGFEDMAEYDSFRAQTEQNLTVSYTMASSFQLIFEIPSMIYDTFPINAGGRERITVGFTGMARRNVGSGHNMKVTLTTVQSFWG